MRKLSFFLRIRTNEGIVLAGESGTPPSLYSWWLCCRFAGRGAAVGLDGGWFATRQSGYGALQVRARRSPLRGGDARGRRPRRRRGWLRRPVRRDDAAPSPLGGGGLHRPLGERDAQSRGAQGDDPRRTPHHYAEQGRRGVGTPSQPRAARRRATGDVTGGTVSVFTCSPPLPLASRQLFSKPRCINLCQYYVEISECYQNQGKKSAIAGHDSCHLPVNKSDSHFRQRGLVFFYHYVSAVNVTITVKKQKLCAETCFIPFSCWRGKFLCNNYVSQVFDNFTILISTLSE